MIIRPTTLILGAGASRPYGFPLGRALVHRLVTLAEDPSATPLFQTPSGPSRTHELTHFARALRFSGRSSVDAFLEHRSEFAEIGKLAIAAALIPHEQHGELFLTGQDERWYQWIWGHLDAPPDDFHRNQLSVITLNYDRSFESYLFTALRSAYGLSGTDAARLAGSVPVIHLHGRLGALPWQDWHETREYEPQLDHATVHLAARSIHVLHETSEAQEAYREAATLIEASEHVYFLGCGYHSLVMDRLPLIERRGKYNVGTGLGLGEAEATEISKRWGVTLEDSTNLALLRKRFTPGA